MRFRLLSCLFIVGILGQAFGTEEAVETAALQETAVQGTVDQGTVQELLTDEMRSLICPMVAEWVQHLNRKRDEYVQKSKFVTWLTDATYDLEVN